MIDEIIEFLIYAVIPYYRRKKRREEEWIGVLEEKKTEGRRFLSKYRGIAVFRTDNGKKIRLKLGEKDFTLYEAGLRYRKKAGEDFPTRFD